MYQVFRNILLLWLVALGACSPKPPVAAEEGHNVPLAMELMDSIERLKEHQQTLRTHLKQRMDSYQLRSVRDIELYEFVGDHDVFKKSPVYTSGTFSDSSKAYSGPAPDDSVVEVMPFKTRFNVVGKGDNRTRVALYSTGKEVYLRNEDLYKFHTALYTLQTDVTISPIQKDENGKYLIQVAFSKYQRKQKQEVQKLSVAYEDCEIMGIGNSLAHGQYVFAFVQTSGNTERIDFYQYHEEGFQIIVSKESQRLASGYDCTRLYLPLEFRNGPTRHVLAVPFQGLFNMATGQANMLEIPDSIDVDPKELVVLQHEKSEMLVGNPRYEAFENNDEMVYIKELVTEYFQWNGTDLSLIASDVTKHQGL